MLYSLIGPQRSPPIFPVKISKNIVKSPMRLYVGCGVQDRADESQLTGRIQNKHDDAGQTNTDSQSRYYLHRHIGTMAVTRT